MTTTATPAWPERAAWTRCRSCGEEMWCHVHQQHTGDCPCPPIEEWRTDPYSDATPHPQAPA